MARRKKPEEDYDPRAETQVRVVPLAVVAGVAACLAAMLHDNPGTDREGVVFLLGLAMLICTWRLSQKSRRMARLHPTPGGRTFGKVCALWSFWLLLFSLGLMGTVAVC